MPADAHPERWRTLHEFVEVDRPFRSVRHYVVAHPQSIMAGGAQATIAGLALDRGVRMVLGDLQAGPHGARVPIHWEDLRHPALFPLLDATLELTPVAGRHPATQIGFFGRYRPPLGSLGALGDTLAGSRLVVESVVTFLTGLAARLERAVPSNDAPLQP